MLPLVLAPILDEQSYLKIPILVLMLAWISLCIVFSYESIGTSICTQTVLLTLSSILTCSIQATIDV